MKKWEYLTAIVAYPDIISKTTVRVVNGGEVTDWKKGTLWDSLSRLGDEGWELVGIHWAQFGQSPPDPIYIFKRPKAE